MFILILRGKGERQKILTILALKLSHSLLVWVYIATSSHYIKVENNYEAIYQKEKTI